jgi:hypothetical protein
LADVGEEGGEAVRLRFGRRGGFLGGWLLHRTIKLWSDRPMFAMICYSIVQHKIMPCAITAQCCFSRDRLLVKKAHSMMRGDTIARILHPDRVPQRRKEHNCSLVRGVAWGASRSRRGPTGPCFPVPSKVGVSTIVYLLSPPHNSLSAISSPLSSPGGSRVANWGRFRRGSPGAGQRGSTGIA